MLEPDMQTQLSSNLVWVRSSISMLESHCNGAVIIRSSVYTVVSTAGLRVSGILTVCYLVLWSTKLWTQVVQVVHKTRLVLFACVHIAAQCRRSDMCRIL